MNTKTIFTLLLSATLSTASFGLKNESDWVNDGVRASEKHLQRAQEYEQEGNWEDAAEQYDNVYLKTLSPTNKCKALFLKATNLEKAGEHYEAFETFNDITINYSEQAYFQPALDGMIRIGDYFSSKKDELFADNSSNARDIYQTVIERAPYGDDAAKTLLKIAEVQKRWYKSEEAITTYKSIIKKYKLNKQEVEESYIQLAETFNNMAEKSDNDAELSFKGIDYLDVFENKFPQSTKQEKSDILRQEFRERIAMYYYNIGYFYTWDANYSRRAAVRYLQRVLLDYPTTKAATKAEALLASLDPNYQETIAKAKEKGLEVKPKPVVPAIKRIDPTEKFLDSKDWENEEILINDPKSTDKWLLPVPATSNKGKK